MLTLPLALIAAYLIGSIPIGIIVGRIRGFDPRAVGSGNIGMTNVARAGGGAAAALTFAGDLLKGLLPVLGARMMNFGPEALSGVALAAFLGSVYSLFLGFSGGRGVSSSLGIWLVLGTPAIAVALAVFLVVLAARRIVSLASVSAAIALPVIAILMHYPRAYSGLALIMAAVVLLRHRANIGRLLRGEEPAIGSGRKTSSAPAA